MSNAPECKITTASMAGEQQSIAFLLAQLLESGQFTNITQPDNAFNRIQLPIEQDWLLWVEPVAKPTANRCQSLYSREQAGKLSDAINQADGWQFSECYWFMRGMTLHAIATSQQVKIKLARLSKTGNEPAKRTPYLWQEAKQRKLQKLGWLEQLNAGQAPLLKDGQLQLMECKSDKATTEYLLMEEAK